MCRRDGETDKSDLYFPITIQVGSCECHFHTKTLIVPTYISNTFASGEK